MKTRPKISVVIAVYNGADHLTEHMDALLKQQCDFPWEAIYVDNGSSDRSRELISQRIARDGLSHVRLVDGSQQRGQVHARNHGSELARADLLAFTDQDDLPIPTWLSELTRALSHADAVGGYTITAPFGYSLDIEPRHITPPENDPKKCCGFDWVYGNNVGIHRHVLQAVGGWQHIGVYSGEDIDLWVRLQLGGYHIVRALHAQVYWRPRVELRDIFSKGIATGRCMSLIYVRYREQGATNRSWRAMLRGIKQDLFSLGSFFHQPRSYEGINRLGCLCGRIYESFRSRVIHF